MRWSHNELVIAKVREMDPGKLYSGLVWEQKNRGYSPKWILANFREIKGCWPPRPLVAIGLEPPDNILREYLGIKKNRWKHKKRREEIKQGRMVLGALKQPEEFSNDA